MRKSVLVVFLVIFFAVLAGARSNTESGGPEKAPAVAASPSETRLPVKRVVLCLTSAPLRVFKAV